jgi:hypothetical protein
MNRRQRGGVGPSAWDRLPAALAARVWLRAGGRPGFGLASGLGRTLALRCRARVEILDVDPQQLGDAGGVGGVARRGMGRLDADPLGDGTDHAAREQRIELGHELQRLAAAGFPAQPDLGGEERPEQPWPGEVGASRVRGRCRGRLGCRCRGHLSGRCNLAQSDRRVQLLLQGAEQPLGPLLRQRRERQPDGQHLVGTQRRVADGLAGSCGQLGRAGCPGPASRRGRAAVPGGDAVVEASLRGIPEQLGIAALDAPGALAPGLGLGGIAQPAAEIGQGGQRIVPEGVDLDRLARPEGRRGRARRRFQETVRGDAQAARGAALMAGGDLRQRRQQVIAHQRLVAGRPQVAPGGHEQPERTCLCVLVRLAARVRQAMRQRGRIAARLRQAVRQRAAGRGAGAGAQQLLGLVGAAGRQQHSGQGDQAVGGGLLAPRIAGRQQPRAAGPAQCELVGGEGEDARQLVLDGQPVEQLLAPPPFPRQQLERVAARRRAGRGHQPETVAGRQFATQQARRPEVLLELAAAPPLLLELEAVPPVRTLVELGRRCEGDLGPRGPAQP